MEVNPYGANASKQKLALKQVIETSGTAPLGKVNMNG